MARLSTISGLLFLLCSCTNYGSYDAMDWTGGSAGDTIRTAALGGLVGGAAGYVATGHPGTGAAIGAVTGAAIEYFDPN